MENHRKLKENKIGEIFHINSLKQINKNNCDYL